LEGDGLRVGGGDGGGVGGAGVGGPLGAEAAELAPVVVPGFLEGGLVEVLGGGVGQGLAVTVEVILLAEGGPEAAVGVLSVDVELLGDLVHLVLGHGMVVGGDAAHQERDDGQGRDGDLLRFGVQLVVLENEHEADDEEDQKGHDEAQLVPDELDDLVVGLDGMDVVGLLPQQGGADAQSYGHHDVDDHGRVVLQHQHPHGAEGQLPLPDLGQVHGHDSERPHDEGQDPQEDGVLLFAGLLFLHLSEGRFQGGGGGLLRFRGLGLFRRRLLGGLLLFCRFRGLSFLFLFQSECPPCNNAPYILWIVAVYHKVWWLAIHL